MSKPKLTYFDGAWSRGEECRLAVHVAGVDFEDRRIKREEWLDLKPETPFGSLPRRERVALSWAVEGVAAMAWWSWHPC